MVQECMYIHEERYLYTCSPLVQRSQYSDSCTRMYLYLGESLEEERRVRQQQDEEYMESLRIDQKKVKAHNNTTLCKLLACLGNTGHHEKGKKRGGILTY